MPEQLPNDQSQKPRRQPSSRQLEANRANARRSKGPKTPEGLAACARHATRHGILAKTTVLEHEDSQPFHDLVNQYLTRFAPVDDIEMAHVEDIASSYWRIRRVRAVETRTLDNEAQTQSVGDELDRIAGAFHSLADQGRIDLYMRYESHLHRRQHRAFRALLALKDRSTKEASAPATEIGTLD